MLTKTELDSIFSATSKTDKGIESLNDVARKAVRKAYSNPEDKGEYARTLFSHVADGLKSPIARFFRACGLNVTLDGKKDSLSMIGDVVDRTKQATLLPKLDGMNAIVLDIEGDKAKRVKKDPDGTWAEQADKAITDMVKRLKKERPEVAGIVNQRLQAPAPWVAKFAQLNLDASEVDAVIEYIIESRMVEGFERKAA
jgi:hypothetical protein